MEIRDNAYNQRNQFGTFYEESYNLCHPCFEVRRYTLTLNDNGAVGARVSMARICDRAGIARSTPSRWRNARNNANLTTVLALDAALTDILAEDAALSSAEAA